MKTEITSYQPGEIPAKGFLRQSQLVLNNRRLNQPAILPFSAATLWRKVRTGEFPKPVKISARVTAWRVEDIRAWMDSLALEASKGRAAK